MSRRPRKRIPDPPKARGVIFVSDDDSFNGNAVRDKKEEVSKFRRQVSRLASVANKRVERLEKNGFKNSPAYKAYLETGGKFGIKGKTYQEVQAEAARLKRFIDARTSTTTGVTSFLKETASNINIKYSSMTELYEKSEVFFELASKTEQYLRNVEDMASAIGYQKIWEAINVYTDEQRINLADTTLTVEQMVESLGQAIAEQQKPEAILPNYNPDNESFWFQLPKD